MKLKCYCSSFTCTVEWWHEDDESCGPTQHHNIHLK